MLDTNSLKPLYIQLEAEIRQALREKKYLPGDRLPSEEEPTHRPFAEKLKVFRLKASSLSGSVSGRGCVP